jgi:hypothetical protein
VKVQAPIRLAQNQGISERRNNQFRLQACSVSRYLRDFSQINCDGVSHAVYGSELKF